MRMEFVIEATQISSVAHSLELMSTGRHLWTCTSLGLHAGGGEEWGVAQMGGARHDIPLSLHTLRTFPLLWHIGHPQNY